MKELNQMQTGDLFRFAEKGLKYYTLDLDGKATYKICNKRTFKCISPSQFIVVEFGDKKDHYSGETVGEYWKETGEIINCFISGRGENKKLYYSQIEVLC